MHLTLHYDYIASCRSLCPRDYIHPRPVSWNHSILSAFLRLGGPHLWVFSWISRSLYALQSCRWGPCLLRARLGTSQMLRAGGRGSAFWAGRGGLGIHLGSIAWSRTNMNPAPNWKWPCTCRRSRCPSRCSSRGRSASRSASFSKP